MCPEMERVYLAAILDTSDDVIVAADLDGLVIGWNRAATQIFGYAVHEMIGQPISRLYAPDQRREEDRIVEQVRRGERVGQFETLRRTQDGRIIPVALTLAPILGEGGRVIGFSSIARVPSDSQRGNADARQWADAFEKAAFGIAIIDGRTNLVQFANSSFANMLGMEPAEIRGMKIGDIYAPSERPLLAGLAAEIDRTGHLAFDSWHVRKNGSVYPVHMDVTAVRDRDGTVLYRIASASDISERKRAEHELQEARRHSDEMLALLDTLQSSAPIGIASIDRSFRYIRANEVLAAINGYHAADIIGRPVREVVGDIWPKLEPIFRTVIDKAESFVNVEVQRPVAPSSTEMRYWLNSYYPVRMRDEIIGIGAIVVEVTDQKRLERRLIHAQKMEALGNLTGGMAHDFNNLLSVIIGNLGLLRDNGEVRSEQQPLLSDAIHAAERGADLIAHLLAFARRQPLQVQKVDLNKLVEGIVRLLQRTLGEAIEISLDLAPDTWPIVVDPIQLEASLTNLATNARDAMPNGGRLEIVTANRTLDKDYAAQLPDVKPGDYVLIRVSDTGKGMSAEVLSRIFEPFFTTKAEGKGTGLGLSMVFGFVKQSGGHINVYSEVDRGTTVSLYLPRALDHRPVTSFAKSDQRVAGGHETVLVVEDNAAMRRVVIRQLTELGYKVIAAENAGAGLAILENEPIDLLFTDLVMPGAISGSDLAHRAASRWPRLKIVLTSGFPENRLDDATASTLKSLRLLSKPYRKDDLARVLREALDS